MEFLNKPYYFEDNAGGHNFKIIVIENNGMYFALIEFTDGNTKSFAIPVTVQHSTVESAFIDVKQLNNNVWYLNGGKVNEFQVHCEFINGIMTSNSVINILHSEIDNSESWMVAYPFSYMGMLVC